VTITSAFLLFGAVLWAVFGLIIALGAHPALPSSPLYRPFMAFLSLVTAGLLLVLVPLLRRHSRAAWFLTLGMLIVIAFLILTDEFGLADLLFLAMMLVPLILLIKDRAWYLHPKPSVAPG
jgi:lysylphosphatidylglycerol synthetase-like protein (DUF2156 family)